MSAATGAIKMNENIAEQKSLPGLLMDEYEEELKGGDLGVGYSIVWHRKYVNKCQVIAWLCDVEKRIDDGKIGKQEVFQFFHDQAERDRRMSFAPMIDSVDFHLAFDDMEWKSFVPSTERVYNAEEEVYMDFSRGVKERYGEVSRLFGERYALSLPGKDGWMYDLAEKVGPNKDNINIQFRLIHSFRRNFDRALNSAIRYTEIEMPRDSALKCKTLQNMIQAAYLLMIDEAKAAIAMLKPLQPSTHGVDLL